MGLRERASDYSKAVESTRGVDLGLELRPDLNRKNDRRNEAEPSDIQATSPAPSDTERATKHIVSAADFPESMGTSRGSIQFSI